MIFRRKIVSRQTMHGQYAKNPYAALIIKGERHARLLRS
jgi:hypothetical protein